MLAGYADEHVDFRIGQGLRRHGMDIVTAQERNQRQTDDEILLESAAEESRFMVTNDADFLRIHGQWMAQGKKHAGLVYWPHDKYSIGQVIRRILTYAAPTPTTDAVNTVKFL